MATMMDRLQTIEDWFKSNANEWATFEEIRQGTKLSDKYLRFLTNKYKGAFERRTVNKVFQLRIIDEDHQG